MRTDRQLALAAALTFTAILRPADAATDPVISYYDVSGKSAAAVRAQMDAMGPVDDPGEHFDAMTYSRLAYTYRYASLRTDCRITQFDATLETTMTMPRWPGLDPASRLGKRWQAYLDALYAHEMGHAGLGEDALEKLKGVAQQFQAPMKCDEIEPALRQAFENVRQDLARAQVDYDQKTDHGKSQGAVFP